MGKIIKLEDVNKTVLYPLTWANAVTIGNITLNENLEDKLNIIESALTEINEIVGDPVHDVVKTIGTPVLSSLTFDNTSISWIGDTIKMDTFKIYVPWTGDDGTSGILEYNTPEEFANDGGRIVFDYYGETANGKTLDTDTEASEMVIFGERHNEAVDDIEGFVGTSLGQGYDLGWYNKSDFNMQISSNLQASGKTKTINIGFVGIISGLTSNRKNATTPITQPGRIGFTSVSASISSSTVTTDIVIDDSLSFKIQYKFPKPATTTSTNVVLKNFGYAMDLAGSSDGNDKLLHLFVVLSGATSAYTSTTDKEYYCNMSCDRILSWNDSRYQRDMDASGVSLSSLTYRGGDVYITKSRDDKQIVFYNGKLGSSAPTYNLSGTLVCSSTTTPYLMFGYSGKGNRGVSGATFYDISASNRGRSASLKWCSGSDTPTFVNNNYDNSVILVNTKTCAICEKTGSWLGFKANIANIFV